MQVWSELTIFLFFHDCKCDHLQICIQMQFAHTLPPGVKHGNMLAGNFSVYICTHTSIENYTYICHVMPYHIISYHIISYHATCIYIYMCRCRETIWGGMGDRVVLVLESGVKFRARHRSSVFRIACTFDDWDPAPLCGVFDR